MRLALLVSGGGTTAAAVIEACRNGRLSGITPACVIASRPGIGALEKARAAGIPEKDILVLEPKTFASESAFGEAMLAALHERNVDLIGQYGWLARTPANVIAAYPGMMINQHPGPLDPGHPDFGGKGMYGRRVHAARISFVQKVQRDFWSEATAQRVAEDYDFGKVLKAQRVEILPGDDAAALAARMLPFEHEVQIATLEDFMNNRVAEVVRAEPLVRPGEEAILEEAKKVAIELFPHG